ncbi:hypothetical protein CPC08DRAFT_815235 [Agrocybe pediades]|nr:hypothetical protein CPC08DRAFT_815235 [Agrocybe pediades]
MDRDDNSQNRQSSLPSSLIPHLYTAPQQPRDSSTRTTLDREDINPPVSPVFPLYTPPPYSIRPTPWQEADPGPSSSTRPAPNFADVRPVSPGPPIYPPPSYSSRNTAWREGEPGPSSLAQPILRRIGSYPLRVPEFTSRFDLAPEPERDYREVIDSRQYRDFPEQNYAEREYRDFTERDYRDLAERDYMEREYREYWPSAQSSRAYNIQQASTSSSSSYSFQALPPPQSLLNPNTEDPSASSFTFDRHDAYTYPPVGSLSISAPTSTRFRTPDSPDIYHPMYRYQSDSRSLDLASNDGDGSQSGKRRRAESLEADNNSGRARNTRKTPVACNFCRGRKLRCNGAKPSCYNCTVRKFECEYVPVQRRRGPGKAKRGTRPKRVASVRDTAGSSRTATDQPPIAVPEYELDALAPELRPYTSVLSLENYQPPPDLTPNYGAAPAPDPRLPEEYHSRTRTSRSRESSEDRSEADEIYRK